MYCSVFVVWYCLVSFYIKLLMTLQTDTRKDNVETLNIYEFGMVWKKVKHIQRGTNRSENVACV